MALVGTESLSFVRHGLITYYRLETVDSLRTVTSVSDTLGTDDVILHVTYTATDTVMIWLPSSENISGRIATVKDGGGNATTNTIRVRAESATIDGLDSMLIDMNYGVLNLYSDGTNWFVR